MSDEFDLDNFVIDNVKQFIIYYTCPSCGEKCALVNVNGVLQRPDSCPNCGFDIAKYEMEEELKKKREIESNPYCQLRYDMNTAYFDYNIKLQPQAQMKELGYKLIDSVPQPIADCWWFTVDKFIEPLPPYLHKMKYTVGKP